MRVFSLSASKIKAYKLCPFKFYLEYHRFLSTGTSFAAENGSMIHVVFEKAGEDIRDGVKPEDSYIINNWHNEVLYAYQKEGIWKLSKEAIERQKQCDGCAYNLGGLCEIAGLGIDAFEGCPISEYEDSIILTQKILNHPQLEFPLNRKVLEVEDHFHFEIPDGNEMIQVNGVIDVITELDKDTIEIVDYKTGKWTQSWNECAKDPQLLIYNLAVNSDSRWRNYENFMVTIMYLRKKTLHLSFDKSMERKTEDALKHYYHVISNDNSPVRIRDKPGYHRNRREQVICEKMCDMKLCDQEYEKFLDNELTVLPSPEKPPRDRKIWLSHLNKDEEDAT